MSKSAIEAAEVAFSSGDLAQAELLCQQLSRNGDSIAAASHLLGAIALRRKNPAQAVQWIERAIEHGLVNTIVLSNCGEAYRQLGRLEDAFSRFEQALRIDNTNSYAHLNLGLVMRSLGHAKESEHFFRTALAIKPGMARAHSELAELYRQEGHWVESEAEYKEALALIGGQQYLKSSSPFLQWNIRLASLLRERGKPLESIVVLEGVLPKCGLAIAHYEIARAKFELSWMEGALDHYTRAIRLLPSLARNLSSRVVPARVTSIKDWGESEGGQYTHLARPHFLNLPSFRTIPTAARESFVVGTAVAPELGCGSAQYAEILSRDFVVLVQERVLVSGVFNWAQHYAQRGQFVCHESDDGRVLLDLPERVDEYEGACILIGKADDQYAWLFECLARLWVIEQMPHLNNLPLVISADLAEDRLEMLSQFDVSVDRLLRLGDDRCMRARELHIPTLPIVGDWISPLALQFLRRRLAGPRLGPANRRVFLSRKGLLDRRLANEEEVCQVLQAYDFEVVRIAEKTCLELISILREANLVIGIDDDAMANLVVCPQGARVGIIATAGAYRPRAHFICGQLAQELTYLVGEPHYDSNPILGLCDMVLPKAILAAFLHEADRSAQ